MGNWSRRKVMQLAKGFSGRKRNCYGIALRSVHKAAQYMYRDRKNKKRTIRREWISTINAATREHGLSYSRFAFALEKTSNVQLDRKILSQLAITEPYSFKAVLDEVSLQAGFTEMLKRRPCVQQMTGVSYASAIERGFIKQAKLGEEVQKVLAPEPKYELYGLRFPERDAKTERDYMRLSFKDEDEAFKKEQERYVLTDKEQKALDREVLTDNWEEDMNMYKNKRRPE